MIGVCGVCCVGVRFDVCGIACVVCGLRCVVCGLCCTVLWCSSRSVCFVFCGLPFVAYLMLFVEFVLYL